MINIREIEYSDLEKGFLLVLNNLLPPNIDNKTAQNILEQIKSNPSHKIFVAEDIDSHTIVGTITLLIEPKFIDRGRIVGYIEDVSVKKGYEGIGIGKQLVQNAVDYAKNVRNCNKILLYCSKNNKPFYEKLGFKESADTVVMYIT